MPKVYNKYHKDAPKDAIYIGRPSKWGNPYEIGRDGTRDEVVEKYRQFAIEHIHTSDLFVKDLEELRGKDLVCWCAPKLCHGHILLSLANTIPLEDVLKNV